MVAVKAHEADAFLRSLSPKIAALLFYGSDEGLVAERAANAAKAAAAATNPPGEILRLDDLDLEQDPGRIAVELTTISMFGGKRIVRATASRRITSASIGPLLSAPIEGMLILEAGNLKQDEGLRGLFEKSPGAAAIACYSDSDRDLETVIRNVLSAHKLDISVEARQALVARLGADRIQSRSEIEKLALYCYGRPRVEMADVEMAVGDASELALDAIISAAVSGQPHAAMAATDRAISAGESPQGLIIAMLRYFQRIHRVRSALETTGSMETALRALRPPLHFKARDTFVRHVNAWPGGKILGVLERITAAQRASRGGALDDALVADKLILDIARLGALTGRTR